MWRFYPPPDFPLLINTLLQHHSHQTVHSRSSPQHFSPPTFHAISPTRVANVQRQISTHLLPLLPHPLGFTSHPLPPQHPTHLSLHFPLTLCDGSCPQKLNKFLVGDIKLFNPHIASPAIHDNRRQLPVLPTLDCPGTIERFF